MAKDDRIVPLAGYSDRMSVRPGETIEFKVSSTGTEPFTRPADPFNQCRS